MTTEMGGRLPDITLERYRLNELPPEEARRVGACLREDAALRQRLAALERSDDEIRATGFVRELQARLPRVASSPARAGRGWVWPLLAGAAASLLVVLMPRISDRPIASGDRLKGLQPSLTVFRRAEGGSETLADGAVAHQGDLLRVGYRAAGRAYGVILSIDGRGGVTLHLPPNGDRAATLGREPTVLLDQAYELDDAPRWERFYLITSDVPFAVGPVLDAARHAARRVTSEPPALALPRGLEQSTFSLQKEEQP